jgi:FkbM family methyltransferase
MQLFKTLFFILNHPINKNKKFRSLINFFKWQINCKINNFPIIYTFTSNSKLIIYKGMAAATGNYYCGLMEYADMAFLLHFLREDDLFVDIGSNIGTYTILASAEIGAKSISVEPIPNTFKLLEDNIKLNGLNSKVKALNIGLSSSIGSLKFTKSLDSVNHVASTNDFDKDLIEVNINTLDNILLSEISPCILKIDVEGFETEVLLGAEKTLNDTNLKAIIIELNGSGSRYGYDEIKLHEMLLDFGFSSYTYNPLNRKLEITNEIGDLNTIYVRDFEYVEKRIKSQRQISIGANNFIL